MIRMHLSVLLSCLLLFGCVTTRTPNADTDPSENVVKAIKNTRSHSSTSIENLTIGEVIRIEEPDTQNLYDDSRYDFPITVNSKVEGWIDYFTGRGRHHMERYLSRSTRYMPVMKKIFKQAGLPEDLVFLALIESGFNLRAKSRARAVGPWQFIKATGKRYGLRVDAWIDERRDPIRSSEAAASSLKDLYLMFESWYLAAAAYNAGEYKILRAIDSAKTNNFWRLSETRLIRRETKDYIPKLISAAIIAKNPKKYGFDGLPYEEPLDFETVTVHYPIRLQEVAKMVDASNDDLEELNPHLIKKMVPTSVAFFDIRVPPGTKKIVDRALASNRTELAATSQFKEHTVRRGETLASIAQKYGVSTRRLADANNLGSKERIQTGSQVFIPDKTTRQVEDRVAASAPDSAGFVTHTVQSGDSLWSISEQYDVTVQKLFQWNNLRRSRIHPGKKIRIKVDKTGSTAQAPKNSRS